MKLIKILSLLVLVVLTVSVTSCNKVADKDNSQIASEAPTIEYMLPWDPGLPIGNDLWVIQEWGKKVGVKFNINSPPRDVFREKFATVVASGNIPDMVNFFRASENRYDLIYGSKLFASVSEYLDKGKLPNMQIMFDKFPQAKIPMTRKEDGKMYGFVQFLPDVAVSDAIFVRNDILKKEGMDSDNIKTLDDFKNAMLALQKHSKDGYITSTRNGYGALEARVGTLFGVQRGVMYDIRTTEGTKKYVYGALQPNYKKVVEFIKWMYEKKLLHPNFITMNEQELYAGFGDGKFTMSFDANGFGERLNPNSSKDREIKVILPPTIDGKKYLQPLGQNFSVGYRWPVVISNKSKYVAEAMKAMDFAYSDEGVEMFMLGKEGMTFTKDHSTPSGYKLDKVQSVWTMNADGTYPEGMKKLQDYGCNTWWLAGYIPAYNRLNLLSFKTNEDEPSYSMRNTHKRFAENAYVAVENNPDQLIVFTKEESDEMATNKMALETYISENVLNFVVGQKPMEEWDSFIEGIKKYNPDSIVEMYNKKLAEIK